MEEPIGVKNRRRIFHPAEAGSRLQVSELLIWERADRPGEEVDDIPRVAEGTGQHLRLLRLRIDGLAYAAHDFGVAARTLAEVHFHEWRGSDDHQVRCDALRLTPA